MKNKFLAKHLGKNVKWWYILIAVVVAIIAFKPGIIPTFLGAVTVPVGYYEEIMDCEFPGEVFDKDLDKCVCPTGTTFSWDTKTCITNPAVVAEPPEKTSLWMYITIGLGAIVIILLATKFEIKKR